MVSGGKDKADKPKKKPGRRFVTSSQITWSCQLTWLIVPAQLLVLNAGDSNFGVIEM
jgi:hypothetical protein